MSSEIYEKEPISTLGQDRGAGGGALKSPPNERIVSAATELFRKHGIRGIGVDAIAEAAGTNKMTLYRHFNSKDDLVVACLSRAAAEADKDWTSLEASHADDPGRRLEAWVQMAAQRIAAASRGCDLANAAVELADCAHPAKKLVLEFKRKQRDRLAALCRETSAQPEMLADALSLLLEGARVSRQSVGPEGPSASFVRASEALIASAGARRR